LTEWIREPLLKVLLTTENLGHQKVHERPQLHNIVLEGSACQQQSAARVEPQQSLPALTLEILYVLSFIQNHVIPFLPSENKMVLNYQFIGSYADMEGVVFAPALSFKFPFLL
jgi:hypothetical protein